MRRFGRAERAVWTLSLLLVLALAGCVDPAQDMDPDELRSVSLYEYRFRGDDVIHPEHPYGWMMRITNTAGHEVDIQVDVGDEDTRWGPVRPDGWATTGNETETLGPGVSVLYLFQRDAGRTIDHLEYGVAVVAGDGNVLEAQWLNRSLQRPLEHLPVSANDHVTTRTVGVWVNGTSFYTNIRELNDNATFPAGYDRETFGGSDLRVYVYEQEFSEQPAGSRDRCWFVTIPGYNDLLKSQAEGTTNIRFLQPEEAYTREGAEEHHLYGDALIFMNKVVAHAGEVTPLQALPQPTGDCFDQAHTTGVPTPDPSDPRV